MFKRTARTKVFIKLPAHRGGQSLIEVLVAVAVGIIFVVAAATLVSVVLRTHMAATHAQVGAGLAKALLDNVRVWVEGNWNNLATSSVARGPNNHYYLTTTLSPFTLASGDEQVLVGTSTYSRYFYVQDVERAAWSPVSSNNPIVSSGGVVDPSTVRMTVVYWWPRSATRTIATYLSRNRNEVLFQTDWSGGPGQAGPLTSTNRLFASSTPNINYTTSTGSFMLSL